MDKQACMTLLPAGRPVSPPALPGIGSERPMEGGCGRSTSGSCGSAALVGSLLRTLVASSLCGMAKQPLPAWRQKATKFGRLYWELTMWEPRSGENGSGLWATARAEDSEQRGAHRGTPDSLTSQSRQWSTPQASLATAGSRSRGGERSGELLLAGQAMENWPTPRKSDGQRGAEGMKTRKSRAGGMDLLSHIREAGLWATPTTSDAKGSGPVGSASQESRLRHMQLDAQVLGDGGRPAEESPNTPGSRPGSPDSSSGMIPPPPPRF